MNEIRAKYLPRFVETARARLQKASTLIAEGSNAASAIAADLHTIAGEASVMGLVDIAEIARASERAVRQVGGLDDGSIPAALSRLARGLEELAATSH